MKILFETADYSEALVIKSLMEQAGFHVLIDNFNTLTAMPHLTAGLGLRVMVPDDDFAEAQKLLADVRAENAPAKATEDSIDRCPECGSENVARLASFWLLPVLWIMNLVYPILPGNRRVCRRCGHRYKSKGPAIAGPLKIAITVWVITILLIFLAGYIWQPSFDVPWVVH